MKTVFATFATDSNWYNSCVVPLRNSFNYWHPNIDFYVFGPEELQQIRESNSSYSISTYKPVMGHLLHLKGYERIILLDADQIITASLDELFIEDYEVAGVRNNAADPDRAGCCGPFTSWYGGSCKAGSYWNCGLVAITNTEIFTVWDKFNKDHAHNNGDGEQGCLNEIVHSGQFKTKLLDSKEELVFFGIANSYGTQTHWDSWKEIFLRDNFLWLHAQGVDKQIKVLHKAGSSGGGNPQDKFLTQFDNLFTCEVATWLKKLTGV